LFTWNGHTHDVPTDPSVSPHTTSPELLRAEAAAAPRTLVDVFAETLAANPEVRALESGAQQLTYQEFADAAESVAAELNSCGVGRGDRVGVSIRSGTTDLYVAIVGVLMSGAAYVPVDAEDPDDRARLVFREAAVAAVLGNDLAIALRRPV
jgi:non-ribosomal peptide synthetase component F